MALYVSVIVLLPVPSCAKSLVIATCRFLKSEMSVGRNELVISTAEVAVVTEVTQDNDPRETRAKWPQHRTVLWASSIVPMSAVFLVATSFWPQGCVRRHLRTLLQEEGAKAIWAKP